MRIRRKPLLFSFALIVAFFSIVPGGITAVRAETLQVHAPILIDGNANFTAANGVVGGSGTASDPYLIENWDIALAPQYGIRIQGTNAHFVIRNVFVHDGAPSSYVMDLLGGISLKGVTNGVLENVTVSKTHYAITVLESDAVTVTNNLVRSSDFGIGVFHSGHSGPIRIVGNNVSSNGLGIWSSFAGPVIVSGNNIDHNGGGIVTYNGGAVITGNTLSNNGGALYQVNDPGPFLNNFINNKSPGEVGCFHHGGCVGQWDDGYPNGGNYWSDLATVDNCSGPNQDVCNGPDGIADKPFDMVAGSFIDRYPLTKPFAPLVSGKVRFEPRSMTSQSDDSFLTAFVRLPKGFESSDLVPSSIRLNGTIAAMNDSTAGQQNGQQDGQQQEHGTSVLVVRFDMTQVRALLSKPGNYVLQVTGNLVTSTNFRPFEASATLRFLSPRDN